MQLTINQLKSAVLEHVSTEWVRENFGKLTLKSTWQDAYDRVREYAAAKMEQAQEVIESEPMQGAIAATKAAWAGLTSEKAQHIYRSIAVVVMLTFVVIAIGLSKAAQYYWADWIKPLGQIAWGYAQGQAVRVWRVACDRADCEWQSMVSLAAIVNGGLE